MSGDDRGDRKEKGLNLKNGSDSGDQAEGEALSEKSLSPEIRVLQDELESKKREYNDLYNKYLLVVADFDNYKKRVAKEKADIITYGNEELIKELLSVLDNLERAIEHSESAEESGPLVDGIRLVHKQFLSCLEKFGVKPIDAVKGERFDPKCHQAIERIESNEITPGLILSERLKGYMLRDRLLRPSLVVVSKEEEEPSDRSDGYKTGNSSPEEALDLVDEELE